MNMNPRQQAHDAASWYFSHIDPYSTNQENIRNHLRGPLLAVTANTLQEQKIPIESPVEEEKKSGGGESWKDFIQPEGPGYVKAQAAYEALSRRSKARMEAFLAGCTLAVPSEVFQDGRNSEADLVDLQDGLTGFGVSKPSKQERLLSSVTEQGKTFIRQISKASSIKHPQIEDADLVLRLELYIRTLQRVKSLNEECVIAMEPPKVTKLRAQYITHDFVATAGCVRDLSPVLTRLLNCLTMEMLAVECLPDKISKAVRRITMTYEHETSFASFAFLSTPEVNASSQLTPLVLKYLKFLQSEWENLVSDAKLEFMISHALDSNMRRVFKTIEFRSIGHLLEVCHEFRSKLHNIELAPNVCAVTENINSLCNSKEAVRQALRDLQREVITVNGHVLPPVTSRKDLLHLMTQTMNSRTLTAPPKPRSKGRKKSKDSNIMRSESCPTLSEPAEVHDINDDSEALFSSECESSGTDFTLDSPLSKASKGSSARRVEGQGSAFPVNSKASEGSSARVKGKNRRSFHLSTIDLLTRRLLIAASRTGNGGDAYFIVYVATIASVILFDPFVSHTTLSFCRRDMFGGEDIEVVPTNTVSMQGRMVRPGTIDILVRLASVTIKCHQSFDVYPRALVGDVEPLIQLHTTTTETISLKEVRSVDSDDGFHTDEHSSVGSGDADTKKSYMVVQEQRTDTTGWRTISVRPALYEKIEVWNTPS
jgi:hypothetical protein